MEWIKRRWNELRPHIMWEILKALMLAAIYPILRMARVLPWDLWVFLTVFLLSFVLLVSFNRRSPPSQASTSQLVAVAPAIPTTAQSPMDVDRFLRTAYIGQLQLEMEAAVRAMIQSRPPNEREEFLTRFIAAGIINALYDNVWLRIYGSQLLALTALNQRLLRREQMKAYYDSAARHFPKVYGNYSFEQWLEFLRANVLILEHPGQTYEITVRGKDFLKYMVHCGYSAENRAC